MSWTGSENQRREQGSCRPPAMPANDTPRYLIPVGVPCEVRRVDQAEWFEYTTKVESSFNRYESYDKKTKCYVFRHEGAQIRIKATHVTHRGRTA